MAEETASPERRKRFNDTNLAIVEKSDRQQTEFRSFVNNSGMFSATEMSALRFDSISAFETQWDIAYDAREKFEASHEHGFGRAAKNAQDFAVSAYGILQHMEHFIQLIKDFGAPYGGMAIGTISFLFTIAKNRAIVEAGISDTLMQIKDRIPGLKVYRHIYDAAHELDQQLQSKIVETYDNFMNFCMETTKYYSKRGFRRWLKAAWGFPGTLEDQASRVQRSIVGVRDLAEELLSKNVDAIKRINIEQDKEIKDLRAQIKCLQDGQDANRLNEIQRLLNLDLFSPESEMELLKRYQRDIQVLFDQEWPNLDLMRGLRLEAFQNEETLRGWKESQHSLMLILSGYNNYSTSAPGECWLSPVALEMALRMRESPQSDPCAVYMLGRKHSELFPQVFSCIISQLLTQNHQAMRDDAQYGGLLATIRNYRIATEAAEAAGKISDAKKSDVEHSEKTDELFQEIALRVVNMFGSARTVWIILDRVDRCRSSSINHRKRLTKALVYLVEHAIVKVRVLAVVNGSDWNVKECHDEFGQRNPSSVVIHTCRQEMVF